MENSRLGKYRITGTLGRGGQALVYLAMDESLSRPVALKRLWNGGENQGVGKGEGGRMIRETERDRLMQEAAFLRDLRHPMLPVVYDLFYEAGWYLVMEYIAGISLHKYIESWGPVKEGQARFWAAALLDVLSYFHTRETPVIYRDLKPDNIMVCKDGSLRLVDFGGAGFRVFGEETDEGMVYSAGYAAPEQRASVEQRAWADERSDIYAFGRTLYYMVTGADLCAAPYGALSVSCYNPLLSVELEEIIARCTAAVKGSLSSGWKNRFVLPGIFLYNRVKDQENAGGQAFPAGQAMEGKVKAHREQTKVITIGDRKIGGGNPILIQSMTNTPTEDVEATVSQILRLEKAGCEIIRCTVPTKEAAKALSEIKKQIHIPLVADIHFDYRMAIAAMENGADKIRINPGNIGAGEKVAQVVSVAKERNIPIRVGVNSGSLERELVEKYHGVTAEGIVESALNKVGIIEDCGYDNLVISIKSSDVMMCVRAHEILALKANYPLHVGITESGTVNSGNIKSAIGLGIMLNQGIGDTIRVSLTGDPVEEIRSAKLILRTLGLRKGGIEVVSCPTCGRTKIDLIGLAKQVEEMVQDIPLDIKVAVMGCAVNGPGEAREADIGIAGGIGEGLLIKRGEIVKKVPEEALLNTLREELLHWDE